MTKKSQHNNILLTITGFAITVIIVGVIGFFAFGKTTETIQGEIEVSEYRVSSKVPGRILELRVKEGDYVKVGDTLAIIDAPDIEAKKKQAESAEDAAAAMNEMADRAHVRNRYAEPTRCGSRPRQVLTLQRNHTSVFSVCLTKVS